MNESQFGLDVEKESQKHPFVGLIEQRLSLYREHPPTKPIEKLEAYKSIIESPVYDEATPSFDDDTKSFINELRDHSVKYLFDELWQKLEVIRHSMTKNMEGRVLGLRIEDAKKVAYELMKLKDRHLLEEEDELKFEQMMNLLNQIEGENTDTKIV